MSLFRASLGFIVCFMGLTACNNKPIPHGNTALQQAAALPMMEHIAHNADKCWFQSNDPSFKTYRLVSELKSNNQKPSIFLFPMYDEPTDRPLLVIQAYGNPARINVFGPLAQSTFSKRIRNNIRNWSMGDNKC